VIPARFASSRFPGKPLADKTGKPLIEHVVDRVRLAKRIDRIIVATDDQRIFDAATKFDCEAVITRKDHPNGTSRIAEAVAGLSDQHAQHPEIVVNVQGDEPLIEPRIIDELVASMQALRHTQEPPPMATVASRFADHEDPRDPNIVKLVVSGAPGQHRAMYFSRSLIPFDRHGLTLQAQPLKHVGLYAYRIDFLLKYVLLPPTPLEQTEQLEQLRALEHGYPIAVVVTHTQHHGIDTPEQYDAFVRHFKAVNLGQ